MVDNPDEWFDVVDAEDRVVSQARRAEVHARGLLHRAVHVLVQRADGAIFLQKRSMEKDTNPGRWDSSSSGHLDQGESYDEAAVRELHEELGIEIEAIDQIGALPASRRTGNEFLRIYRVVHEGPFILHPAEISGGNWFRPEAIDSWLADRPDDFPTCFHEVWQAARHAIL